MSVRTVQQGQAMTEMLVAAVALAAALLLPWLEGESPANLLLGADVLAAFIDRAHASS